MPRPDRKSRWTLAKCRDRRPPEWGRIRTQSSLRSWNGGYSDKSKKDERRTRLQEASRGPSDEQVHVKHDTADHALHDVRPSVPKMVAPGKIDPAAPRAGASRISAAAPVPAADAFPDSPSPSPAPSPSLLLSSPSRDASEPEPLDDCLDTRHQLLPRLLHDPCVHHDEHQRLADRRALEADEHGGRHAAA
jgi:hypothetical protein